MRNAFIHQCESLFRPSTIPLKSKLNGLKYVVWNNKDNEQSIVIFWPFNSHYEMSRYYCDGEVRSAGFISTQDGELACVDKSESLNVSSHPDDIILLKGLLGEYADENLELLPNPTWNTFHK